jgi:hypothetical protein
MIEKCHIKFFLHDAEKSIVVILNKLDLRGEFFYGPELQ